MLKHLSLRGACYPSRHPDGLFERAARARHPAYCAQTAVSTPASPPSSTCALVPPRVFSPSRSAPQKTLAIHARIRHKTPCAPSPHGVWISSTSQTRTPDHATCSPRILPSSDRCVTRVSSTRCLRLSSRCPRVSSRHPAMHECAVLDTHDECMRKTVRDSPSPPHSENPSARLLKMRCG